MWRVWTGSALVALAALFSCAQSQSGSGADANSGCETQSLITTAATPSPTGPTLASSTASMGCAGIQPAATASPKPPPGGSSGTPGTIDTVAGGGIGDGGPATSAVFFLPSYESFDPSGNLYVSTHQRVVKVTPDGIATTAAGTGTIGFQGFGIYYGDGGPATAATFGQGGPAGLAFDPAGDLYIADTGDGVIRKVDTHGVITTVAGGGPTNRYGVEGDDPRSVFLWAPDGIAIDGAGDLFIADAGNCTIREVRAFDGKIYTFAGIPPAQSNPTSRFTCTYTADGVPALGSALDQPKDVKVDTAGNVYIADLGNNRIRKVDTSGLIHTVAGNGAQADSGDGGPATTAGIASPWHIDVEPNGELYIAEYFSDVVRKVDRSGVIATFAGIGTDGFSGDGGPATQAQLFNPMDAAVDAAGNVYLADFGNNRIRRVDAASARITTVAGNGDPPHEGHTYTGNGFAGDGLPARSASLSGPVGAAVDAAGNVFVADTANNRVREIAASDGIIRTVAGTGQAGYSGDGGPATSAMLGAPTGVAVDRRGQLFTADALSGVVRKVDTRGRISTVAGGGHPATGVGDGGPATKASLSAVGIALDGNGNLYIADSRNERVRRVNTKGVISTVAGNGTRGFAGDGGPAAAAELDSPRAVALDTAGNLFIADNGNGRIRKVDTRSVITTVAGNGATGYNGDGGQATSTSLYFPSGVAVDGAGNLFVSDTANCLVREVDASTGRIHVVAGVPLAFNAASPGFLNCDFNGDGGPADQAHIFAPYGLAIDTSGNVFFADAINNRVRVIRN